MAQTWAEWWSGKKKQPAKPEDAAADHDVRGVFLTMLDGSDPPVWFKVSEVAMLIKPETLKKLGYKKWEDALPAVKVLAFDMREMDYCEISKGGKIVPDDISAYEVEGGFRIRRKSYYVQNRQHAL